MVRRLWFLGMDYSASSSRTSSGDGDRDRDDVFTQIIGDIDTIVGVLDSVVDAPKDRHALRTQLSGFKTQITSLETHVRMKQAGHNDLSQPASLEISFTSLQRNVDLVARSLGIDPVWSNSADDRNHDATDAASPKKTSPVSLHCWRFKHKAKKLLRVSAGCKTIRAFSLRLPSSPIACIFGSSGICKNRHPHFHPCFLKALFFNYVVCLDV